MSGSFALFLRMIRPWSLLMARSEPLMLKDEDWFPRERSAKNWHSFLRLIGDDGPTKQETEQVKEFGKLQVAPSAPRRIDRFTQKGLQDVYVAREFRLDAFVLAEDIGVDVNANGAALITNHVVWSDGDGDAVRRNTAKIFGLRHNRPIYLPPDPQRDANRREKAAMRRQAGLWEVCRSLGGIALQGR